MIKHCIFLSFLFLVSCGERKSQISGTDYTSAKDTARVNVQAEKSVIHEKVNNESSPQGFDRDYNVFKADMNHKIEENKREIENLKENIAAAKDGVPAYYYDRIKRAETKNDELLRRLNKFSEKESAKWEDFKRDLNRDVDELKNSIMELNKKDKK